MHTVLAWLFHNAVHFHIWFGYVTFDMCDFFNIMYLNIYFLMKHHMYLCVKSIKEHEYLLRMAISNAMSPDPTVQ